MAISPPAIGGTSCSSTWGRLILVERYCNHGIITWQVLDEISAGISEYPELKQVGKLHEDKTFKLVSLSGTEHQHFLQLIGHLRKGEASCIALAKEQAAIVVTDDRTAKKQCSLMNTPFTGTVGILKASVLDGSISLVQADESLRKMIEAGFYSRFEVLWILHNCVTLD